MKFDTTNNSHRIFSQEVYEKVSAIRGKNPECAKKIEVALNAKGCFFLQNINFIMRMLDNREYDIPSIKYYYSNPENKTDFH